MRRKRLWIPLIVVVVLGLLIVGNLSRRDQGGKEVKVELAETRSLKSWVRAPGLVQPVVSVDISSNVSGRVAQLSVREGDAVAAGTLLLTLDDTRFRSAVAQYEALLGAARSQLNLAEAQRELAEQVLARREDLHGRGLLSSEELESARVDVRVKNATVAAQTDEIARQEAALAESRRDLEETRFTAPIDGVVTALNLEEGENVLIGTMNNPGTVILTLADLSAMEVEARVGESDVVHVDAGQSVQIEVDAMPDLTLEGVVTTVGESGRRSSRDEGAEFEVHVTITAPPEWLRPGMSADVEILVATAEEVTTVPISSLVARTEKTVLAWERGERQRDEEEPEESEEGESDSESTGDATRSKLIPGIFVLEEGKAAFRRIETGVRGESFVEVAEDETIIAGPYRVLRRMHHGDPAKAEKNRSGEEDRSR